MKKIVLFLYLTLASLNLFAQSGGAAIAADYIVVLQSISNYSYSQTGIYLVYTPTDQYGFVGDAMAAMQERYNTNHARCSREYFKLKKLQLVNASNKTALDSYRNSTLSNIETYIKTFDLSNQKNVSNILSYTCKIYEYKPIMDEINLLGAVDKEIRRLYAKDPDAFYKSERYKEMGLVLNRLATCSQDQIPKLAWEYGLIGYGAPR